MSISIDKALICTYVQVEHILKLLFSITLLVLNYQVYCCLFIYLVYFIKCLFHGIHLCEKYRDNITTIYLKLWKGCVPTWHS